MKLCHLSDKNKQAWDSLYARTESKLVWGKKAPHFVVKFVSELTNTFSQDSRILDAASGEGRNLSVLQKLGGHVFACDASAHALRKSQCIQGAITRVQCDLSKLHFETATFDFVQLVDVIETLPEPEIVVTKHCHNLALECKVHLHDFWCK